MAKSRSPAYPYVDLPTAVDMAQKINGFAKAHEANVEALMQHLGFKGMSGSAKKTLAALKYFGLVDQQHGSKNAKLTERAMKIIHGMEDARAKALRDAFLSPGLYEYCYNTWGADEISDQVMKSHLILEKGFNESTVMRFISLYKESMKFAKMADQPDSEDDEDEDLGDDEEGDLGRRDSPPPPPPPPPLEANMRKETFTLSASEVSITFPATMTAEDYEDFEGWIEILKRKIGRRVKNGTQGSDVGNE